MSRKPKDSSESIIRDIKRNTRRKFNSEEKIRIVLEGLKGENSINELCRQEGIHTVQYYKWSKDFMEAGKKRLSGDTAREANTSEVKDLRKENDSLKQLVAELSLRVNFLKKKLNGFGIDLGRYMKYSKSEKEEIIKMVENSDLSVRRTLKQIGVNKSSFYEWYKQYEEDGIEGLIGKHKSPKQFWNAIPETERDRIADVALRFPEKSCREIAYYVTDNEGYFVSESSVYRILREKNLISSPVFTVISAKDKFQNPTTRINELWQTDFTYLRIVHWGWYYLSTVMDDFSRYIIAWKLCKTMKAEDVKDTLELAIQRTGIHNVKVVQKPRLLSDNGSCYISSSLRDFLEQKEMSHTRGKPYHPMTQGKIERYHRSMKNILLLDNYYSPSQLEDTIAIWVEYYNNHRYHESIGNIIPRDKYLGLDTKIQEKRRRIKRETMRKRRLHNKYSETKNIIDNEKVNV